MLGYLINALEQVFPIGINGYFQKLISIEIVGGHFHSAVSVHLSFLESIYL